jgi:hypothetical protein
MKPVGKGKILQVRILYSDGCANTPPTVELVRKVAQELNVSVRIEKVLVSTEKESREHRFLGSPTVQVDGQDIEGPGIDPLAGMWLWANTWPERSTGDLFRVTEKSRALNRAPSLPRLP